MLVVVCRLYHGIHHHQTTIWENGSFAVSKHLKQIQDQGYDIPPGIIGSKPLFATISGKGDTPNIYQEYLYFKGNTHFQRPSFQGIHSSNFQGLNHIPGNMSIHNLYAHTLA